MRLVQFDVAIEFQHMRHKQPLLVIIEVDDGYELLADLGIGKINNDDIFHSIVGDLECKMILKRQEIVVVDISKCEFFFCLVVVQMDNELLVNYQ